MEINLFFFFKYFKTALNDHAEYTLVSDSREYLETFKQGTI